MASVEKTTDGVVPDGNDGVDVSAKDMAPEHSIGLHHFPEDLRQVLKAFDTDGDGTINKSELAAAAKMYHESKQHVRKMYKIIAALSAVLLFLLISIMGLMFMVVEVSKENSTASDGVMTVKGDLNKTVRTDTVESFTNVFDTPALSTETLSYMKQVTFYIEMKDYMAEATFKVAGAYKPAGSKDIAFLETNQGYTIEIDRIGGKGKIDMGNKGIFNVYPDLASHNNGRRLGSAPLQDPVLLSKEAFAMSNGKEISKPGDSADPQGRLLSVFGGALLTSGSFTMMASSGY